MIEATGLTKWYGPVRGIEGLSFRVEPGQVVGFLGPNGAGKSTTLRILTGYMPPTSGTARIAGHDVLRESLAARGEIGYLPESTPLYPEMRVEEYLHHRGRLMGMGRARRRQRIDAVCDRCGLEPVRRRTIGRLSKGNRQRVGLAQALLHEPRVLILDEPTAGLDPNQIQEVRKLIAELRGEHTIMLSTHILPEIERVADRLIVVASGRIVAEGSPEELRRSVQRDGRVVVEANGPAEQVGEALRAVTGVAGVELDAGGASNGWCRALVTPADGADVRAAVGAALLERRLAVREMRHEAASLEAFFVQITAQQERGQ